MKNFGSLNHFLGPEITFSNGNYISHAKYASELLTRASIIDNKIDTPIETNVKLCDTDDFNLPNAILHR